MGRARGLVMKTLKPWIVMALVFIAGVLAGVSGTRFAVRRSLETAMARPEVIPQRIERQLARELGLTPEQRPRIHDIVARRHAELEQLRKDLRPRLGGILKR